MKIIQNIVYDCLLAFIGNFTPNRIFPNRGFVRKNLLSNKLIPIITILVKIEIINNNVGESTP